MLQVILNPGPSPAVFSESIHTSPCSNQKAVEELLASACTAEPELASKKYNGKDDSVSYECAAHYKMSEALAQVIISTKSQSRDASKKHLHPAHDR